MDVRGLEGANRRVLLMEVNVLYFQVCAFELVGEAQEFLLARNVAPELPESDNTEEGGRATSMWHEMQQRATAGGGATDLVTAGDFGGGSAGAGP